MVTFSSSMKRLHSPGSTCQELMPREHVIYDLRGCYTLGCDRAPTLQFMLLNSERVRDHIGPRQMGGCPFILFVEQRCNMDKTHLSLFTMHRLRIRHRKNVWTTSSIFTCRLKSSPPISNQYIILVMIDESYSLSSVYPAWVAMPQTINLFLTYFCAHIFLVFRLMHIRMNYKISTFQLRDILPLILPYFIRVLSTSDLCAKIFRAAKNTSAKFRRYINR